jgi:hypothetical protein
MATDSGSSTRFGASRPVGHRLTDQRWIGGWRYAPGSDSGSLAHVGLVVPELDADVVAQPSGLVGHPFEQRARVPQLLAVLRRYG